MTLYYGSWSANNGSSYNYGYRDTNKNKLAATMRQIMAENIFGRGEGRWEVVDEDGEEVMAGGMRNNQYFRE